MRPWSVLWLAFVCLLTPALAQAQAWRIDPGLRPIDARTREHLITPFGTSVELGGGVADFTDSEVRDYADVAGTWTARAVIGTRTLIGAEAAYVGSASAMNAIGIDNDASLVRNGFEANLRLNLPITREEWMILPYAFAGVGYAHYTIMTDRLATSSLKDDDDVLQVPVGGGLGVAYRMFVIDTRFAFYPTFDDELLRSPTGGPDENAGLESWMVTAHLGYEF